jgi:hypothetical protein
MPANSGSGIFKHDDRVSCSVEPGHDQGDPSPLCDTTYSPTKNAVMTYSMGYAVGGLPSIWTIPPIVGDGLQCAGRQFDASNNLHDGWACVAVVASDALGNKQVSRPIRICVAAQPSSTACLGVALGSVSMPSSIAGKVIVTTKAAVVNPDGSAVAAGDTLVFSNVRPPALAFVGGDHTVTPQGGTGTQFTFTGGTPAPYTLFVDLNDGNGPQLKGPVGVTIADGVDVQVTTDVAGTALDAGFAGSVILIGRGSAVSASDIRWSASNIAATGFSLKGSAGAVTGFVTATKNLPNCTGTVVKSTTGAQAKVDGSIPCIRLSAFPDVEYLER